MGKESQCGRAERAESIEFYTLYKCTQIKIQLKQEITETISYAVVIVKHTYYTVVHNTVIVIVE